MMEVELVNDGPVTLIIGESGEEIDMPKDHKKKPKTGGTGAQEAAESLRG